MDETTIPLKWPQEINDLTIEEWKMYNKKPNYIKEFKLLDFQYKILIRILATNRFLYKIKPIVTDKCSKRVKVSHTYFQLRKGKRFLERGENMVTK